MSYDAVLFPLEGSDDDNEVEEEEAAGLFKNNKKISAAGKTE